MTLSEARKLERPWMNEEYRIVCIETFNSGLDDQEVDEAQHKLKHYCLKYDPIRNCFVSKDTFVRAVETLENISFSMATSVVDALSY